MDPIKLVFLDEIPLHVLARDEPSTFQAVPSKRYETMAYATRSQARQPLSQMNLDLVPNPHGVPKRCRKRKCKKHSSGPMSQSTLIMLNNMRTSVITKQVQAEKAPEPQKLYTDGKEDTLKMMAPTAMSGSTSHIEAINNHKSEDSSGWLEGFVDAELASQMIKSVLELEEGFAPAEFEALPSLDELLSSQQDPSYAASRAEEVLAPVNEPAPSQQDPSGAAPRAEKALSNCTCSQQLSKMVQDLKNDFTIFAQQQNECMEMLTKVLLRMVNKDERGNNNPGPHVRNENLTALMF